MKTTTTTRIIARALAVAMLGGHSCVQHAGAADTHPRDPFYRTQVYGIGPGLRPCEEFPSGVKDSIWARKGVDSVDVVSDVSPSGRAITFTGTYSDRSTAAFQFFMRRDECLKIATSQGASNVGTAEAAGRPADPAYLRHLHSKYLRNIIFKTPRARQVVEGFDIDCKADDGRTLPFINVLLTRFSAAPGDAVQKTTVVDSRGDEVRVYDETFLNGQHVTEELVFVINKWGELAPKSGIRAEAILNSCFGTYGPIWVFR